MRIAVVLFLYEKGLNLEMKASKACPANEYKVVTW